MRILFATDGSKGALAGTGLLRCLNLSESDEIVVLTAGDAGEAPEAQQGLDDTCAALQGTRARLTPEQGEGPAAEVVVSRAGELTPDLLLLGSRGLNPVSRFFLGSVAERVVCHAGCPVLVARPVVGALDRVVVGIDGSEAALRTAQIVRELPLPEGCEVRLATALPFYQVGGTPAGRVSSLAAELRALQLREKEEARAQLEEVAGSFRQADRAVSTELREQHPAEGLLEIAEEQRADLIAVGRQGLSRIERFCMGSVSLNVLRHAACSVLVVPEAPAAAR